MPCAGERTWRDRAICRDRWNSRCDCKTFVANVVHGWRECACGAFGHGMPCPYCRNRNGEKNDVVMRAKHRELRRVFALAQARLPVLLDTNVRRRPEAGGTNGEDDALAAAARDVTCAAVLF